MTIKCDKCNGDGFILDENGKAHDCDRCYTCGYIDVETNEDWLRSASTEELAEWLCEEAWYGIDEVLWLMEREDIDTKKEAMIRWLKEKHEE